MPIEIKCMVGGMVGAVIINQYSQVNQQVLEIRIITSPAKEEDKEKRVEESSD